MAPRRNAKQADAEPIEKAAEAGDASPPKRSKVVKSAAPKVAQKQEPKHEVNQKEARLPRAAKSRKLDQQQQDHGASAEATTIAPASTGGDSITGTAETVTEPAPKKARGKSKAIVQSSAKQHEQQQATKGKRAATNAVKNKSKNIDDKNAAGDAGSDETSGDVSGDAIDTNIAADNSEDAAKSIAKKGTRAKATTKKAGNVESGKEAEVKPKGRTKKNVAVSKDTEVAETVPAKSRKNQKNVEETAPKETKVKAKSVKKDTEKNDTTETKKRTSARTKATTARSVEENNIANAEETATTEGKKTKATTVKKARGKAENTAGTTENNVDKVEEPKTVKGRSKKMNKESSVGTSAPKKGRGKKEPATLAPVQEEEKVELESHKVSESDSAQDIADNNEAEAGPQSDIEMMKEGTDAESNKSDKEHNEEGREEEEEEEEPAENNTDSASVNENEK